MHSLGVVVVCAHACRTLQPGLVHFVCLNDFSKLSPTDTFSFRLVSALSSASKLQNAQQFTLRMILCTKLCMKTNLSTTILSGILQKVVHWMHELVRYTAQASAFMHKLVQYCRGQLTAIFSVLCADTLISCRANPRSTYL